MHLAASVPLRDHVRVGLTFDHNENGLEVDAGHAVDFKNNSLLGTLMLATGRKSIDGYVRAGLGALNFTESRRKTFPDGRWILTSEYTGIAFAWSAGIGGDIALDKRIGAFLDLGVQQPTGDHSSTSLVGILGLLVRP
jgi:hypothetical protein